MFIDDFRAEYQRYRALGEKAIAQAGDEALNAMPTDDANSIAMIVRHVSGNLVSRFTDFLTADGEKPSRDRESEFDIRAYDRQTVDAMWQDGWTVVDNQLNALTDADMERTVTIRNQPMTVHAALSRSLSHIAYHIGQIVLLARIHTRRDWKSLSIPRGESAAFNERLARQTTPTPR